MADEITPGEAKGWVRVNKMVYVGPFAEGANDEGRVQTPGPWHALSLTGEQPLAWCGSRLTGFNQSRSQTKPTEGLLCMGCTRALAKNQPRSWRR